jgi:aminodeoxyfutalosine synthase
MSLTKMKHTTENILQKVESRQRISPEEGLFLYEHAPLAQLKRMAMLARCHANKYNVYFNRNIHIEPSNLCKNHCVFCAFAKHSEEEAGAFTMSAEDIKNAAAKHAGSGITEVHITSGLHPKWTIADYAAMLAAVRAALPKVHIKAFTAEEIWKMQNDRFDSIFSVISQLKDAGLQSLAGGGAEILDDKVRQQICPQKISSGQWLHVHRMAKEQGLHSNATMLYGHVETYSQRILHLTRIRDLQDECNVFHAFIPLKYKKLNAAFADVSEAAQEEDARNMAVCRIFLDNILHLKAYLPAMGNDSAQIMLQCGADDMDGTILDGTQIYAVNPQEPPIGIGIERLRHLCMVEGLTLIERDSDYNAISLIQNIFR